jgi:hypothetical protein
MAHHNELRRIRLELGRTDEFPEGSKLHGYEFVAPLDSDGHIDIDGWHETKRQCIVTRFWDGEPTEQGQLQHVGNGWHFEYRSGEGYEKLFKLDRHAVVPGNYISVTEHGHSRQPFRVASVTSIANAS